MRNFKIPKPCFLLSTKTHQRSVEATPERMHVNFLVLLLPLVTKWYLLCQLKSCWQLNSWHSCHAIQRDLENLVDSTTESWSLGFHCGDGWHKFSKMEGRKSHLPYSCKELPHSQTECWGPTTTNTAFSWLTYLCLFPTKVYFWVGGRGRRKEKTHPYLLLPRYSLGTHPHQTALN